MNVFILRRLMQSTPVIVAYLMMIVFLSVVINLIVDILYSVLDPRVRLGDRSA